MYFENGENVVAISYPATVVEDACKDEERELLKTGLKQKKNIGVMTSKATLTRLQCHIHAE